MTYPSLSGIDAGRELSRVRAAAPLVHCLTNSVVTNFTANVLLAFGAAPAMVVAREEVADFAAIAGALSVNVGTLNAEQAEAIRLAVASAILAGTPWVLDPVAAGALAFRTDFCRELLDARPAAIRGNASEIRALAGLASAGRGVDSQDSSEAAIDAARTLAERCGAVVAVTGEVDYVTDGQRVLAITAGDPLLTRVTGTGCSLSALVAAFLAGADDRLTAVASACATMAVAGQLAAREAPTPGRFAVALLDQLSLLDSRALEGALQ
ncbi:hydroxyethylthiazole kinase [Neisseriaceae bacterium JH1-16]|nr:hydroxyethylthiazole kinase [Neisseriaceae bacterium JH1-16]